MHSPKASSNQTHISDDLGDCIGMESGVDLKSDLDMEGCNKQNCVTSNQDHHKFWGVKKEKKGKEYPPPMPHKPWVMKRYYTSDGRLIINEEKVERHEYFQAHRSNGRLILNLIPLDDSVSNDDDDGDDDDDDDNEVNHAEEEVEENREVHQIDGCDDGGDEEMGKDRTVEDESKTKLQQEFGVLSKCYKYDTVGSSSSSMFSIRPVHT